LAIARFVDPAKLPTIQLITGTVTHNRSGKRRIAESVSFRPKLDDDKLAEQVHSTHPEMPIMLMTGKTEILDSTDLFSIAKPYRASEMANCLQRVL